MRPEDLSALAAYLGNRSAVRLRFVDGARPTPDDNPRRAMSEMTERQECNRTGPCERCWGDSPNHTPLCPDCTALLGERPQNEHTRGPWKVEQGDGYITGRILADPLNDWREVVVGMTPRGAYVQRLADANLIASAPDLLAVLRELTDACNRLPASDGRVIGLNPILVRAHRALLKATGQ